jgi:periplasmic divalent cation tolerance protein
MTDKIVVLVTCGSKKEARKIAQALVQRRLAACAQEIGVPVRSIYRWKGRVESANEVLLLIKTSRKRFSAVSTLVKKLHSYEVPEIIALNIAEGSREYLDWITSNVRAK